MKWKLHKKNLSFFKQNKKNPRLLSRHDADHLSQSIKKFGLCEPIVCNLDGEIIGGHQRVHILQEQKIDEVDVYLPDSHLDRDQCDELNIRLNRNSGEWDYDILSNQWEVDDLLNWGFLDSDLGLDAGEEIDSEEGEIENISPKENPHSKIGDLYELGPHRVLCGDSTSADDVKKLFNDSTPILMVTDPPYGVMYDGSWRNNVHGSSVKIGKVKNDDKFEWSHSWKLFTGNIAYVWHAAWYSADVAKSLVDCGFEIKSQIIWNKNRFAISRGDYHWKHEPCWYAVRKGKNHNWQGSRKECTVWDIGGGLAEDEDEERSAHSTQKPKDCMLKPILNNTEKGEGVYDPFGGSGTTLLCAEDSKRICFMMELDPAYVDIIVDRYIKKIQRSGEAIDIKKNGKEWFEWEAVASQ